MCQACGGDQLGPHSSYIERSRSPLLLLTPACHPIYPSYLSNINRMNAAAIVAVLAVLAVLAAGQHQATSFTFGQIRYTFYPGEVARSWYEADAFCQSLNKELAVFATRTQIRNVSEYLSPEGGVWTGYKTNDDGRFEAAELAEFEWKKEFGTPLLSRAKPAMCGLLSVANYTGIVATDCDTRKAALCSVHDPDIVEAETMMDAKSGSAPKPAKPETPKVAPSTANRTMTASAAKPKPAATADAEKPAPAPKPTPMPAKKGAAVDEPKKGAAVDEPKKAAVEEPKKVEETKPKKATGYGEKKAAVTEAVDEKKAATDDKKAAEEERKAAEADRKQAELERKKAEEEHKLAAEERRKAADDKKKADDDKKLVADAKKKAADAKKKATADGDKKKKAASGAKPAADEETAEDEDAPTTAPATTRPPTNQLPVQIESEGGRFTFFPNHIMFGGYMEYSRFCEDKGLQPAVFTSRRQLDDIASHVNSVVMVWTGYTTDSHGGVHSADERNGPWIGDFAVDGADDPAPGLSCGALSTADKKVGVTMGSCASAHEALCSAKSFPDNSSTSSSKTK